jgi:hypothetical protein
MDLWIPGAFQEDALTAVLRDGARRLLAQAVEAEVAAFLAQHSSQVTGEGHQRVYVHTTSGTRSQRYRLNMINMLLM